MAKESKLRYILVELGYHLPFSIFGVTLGLLAMGVLSFLATIMNAEHLLSHASEELFHVFHPAHILISAVVTTAMFIKHEKRVFKAVLVGFVGSIVICAVSDIVFPYFGGLLIGSSMEMHICVLEEPVSIIPFAVIGVIAGLLVPEGIEHSTQYTHSAHVFLSSVASILYLCGYGLTGWVHVIGPVFLVIIVAVMIPCCASDIVFPLACAHRNCHHSKELSHDHPH